MSRGQKQLFNIIQPPDLKPVNVWLGVHNVQGERGALLQTVFCLMAFWPLKNALVLSMCGCIEQQPFMSWFGGFELFCGIRAYLTHMKLVQQSTGLHLSMRHMSIPFYMGSNTDI